MVSVVIFSQQHSFVALFPEKGIIVTNRFKQHQVK
jgi:hypothetical protein